MTKIRATIGVALLLSLTAAATAPVRPAVASFVEQEARNRELSGVVLIRRDGGQNWMRSFGLADRAFAVPMTAGTRFRIASITKLFTATMIMMLAEERRLHLDQPVRRYLPELKGGARDVTIWAASWAPMRSSIG